MILWCSCTSTTSFVVTELLSQKCEMFFDHVSHLIQLEWWNNNDSLNRCDVATERKTIWLTVWNGFKSFYAIGTILGQRKFNQSLTKQIKYKPKSDYNLQTLISNSSEVIRWSQRQKTRKYNLRYNEALSHQSYWHNKNCQIIFNEGKLVLKDCVWKQLKHEWGCSFCFALWAILLVTLN